MIHIATVHWNTAKWIAPQQSYLRRNLRSPYRVYAWLNNIPDAPAEGFYSIRSEPVESRAAKLNTLAEAILASPASDDDLLMFLDGDAFPVGDVEALLEKTLPPARLVAVQRLENDGDPQPHPSFCATTVGFWREIKGDWNAGYFRKRGRWRVTDMGGNLLGQLTERGVPWVPLLRSNKVNLHPVFFGIYGGVIYHHGAGFRKGENQIDETNLPLGVRDRVFGELIPGYRGWARRKAYRKVIARNAALSEQVYETIQNDPQFFRQFM